MKFLSSDAARTVVLELVDNVLSSHSGPACDFHPSAVAPCPCGFGRCYSVLKTHYTSLQLNLKQLELVNCST